MFENAVMLVHSHTDYDFILNISMQQIIKFFPEIRVCLCTNNKTKILESLKDTYQFYKIYEYPETMPFSTRIRTVLSMIDEEFLIFNIENNVLIDKVHVEEIEKLLVRMKNENIDQIRFHCGTKGRSVCHTFTKGEPINGLYEIGGGYYFSGLPGVWKTSAIKSIFNLLHDTVYGLIENKTVQDFTSSSFKNYLLEDSIYKLNKQSLPYEEDERFVTIYPIVHPFNQKYWLDEPKHYLSQVLSKYYKKIIHDLRNQYKIRTHPYLELRNSYADKVIFELSSIGYAVKCDFSIYFDYAEQRDIELDRNYISSLRDKSSIFLYPHAFRFMEKVKECCDILIKNNIRVNWYYVCEPYPTQEMLLQLFQCGYKVFVTNNIWNHPQIHHLPLGIRDGEEAVPHNRGFTHNYLYNEGMKKVEKKYLCLLCYTHGPCQERLDCTNYLGNAEFVLNLNKNTYEKQVSIHCGKVPVWINYEKTHESQYTLAPMGVGRATHRFFEAIYLRSIPIVQRSNTVFDSLYNFYPCLVIDNWSDITRELLEKNLEPMTKRLDEFLEKYPHFLTNIYTIEDQMVSI